MKKALFAILACVLLATASTSLAIVCSLNISEEDLRQKRTGDYSTMLKERVIRALVPVSRTYYFLDGGMQRGLTYELLREFEDYLNEQEKTAHLRIKVIVIPTPRNRLFADLEQGIGDIAAGNLNKTASQEKSFDFSDPFIFDVNEIVVTGRNEPPLKSLFDLAGRRIFVRKTSSYYESLVKLNRGLKSIAKEPVEIIAADEHLEDGDLLEMVNAGVIPAIIVQSHKAKLWSGIFKNTVAYEDIKINTGSEIVWSFRKNSPELENKVNQFVKRNRQGTLIGNVLINRYFKDTAYINNNLASPALKKFDKVAHLFKKYGSRYDFDWLMLTALAYQESKLDNSKRSKSGAVGIMQVLPNTASDANVNISNIELLENNIHAGAKYLRFMIDRYCVERSINDMNKKLFALASYNAGPARVQKLRKQAAARGLDPNIWFNNVEVIAAGTIGLETVRYVSNIYKYYVAYKAAATNRNLKEIKKPLFKEHYRQQNEGEI